jgi:hypothetical protein
VILSPTSKADGHSGIVYAPFMEALGRLGWVAGRNVEIVERFAEDHYERLPALVATQPDVIFTNTVNGALAAAEPTSQERDGVHAPLAGLHPYPARRGFRRIAFIWT